MVNLTVPSDYMDHGAFDNRNEQGDSFCVLRGRLQLSLPSWATLARDGDGPCCSRRRLYERQEILAHPSSELYDDQARK